MSEVSIIGLDISKHVFQAHGADASGQAVLHKKISRAKLLPFFASQPRCRAVLEACGGAHYWARELTHSTGGKQKLGGISRMGERTLRRLLIIGSSAVVLQASRIPVTSRFSEWLQVL